MQPLRADVLLLRLSRPRHLRDALKWNFSESFLPQARRDARCRHVHCCAQLKLRHRRLARKGGEAEECVMRLCGRSLGAQDSLNQNWPRAEKLGHSNAHPQTPAAQSNLHFLPPPPTNALHLLEERFTSSFGHTRSSLTGKCNLKYTNCFECQKRNIGFLKYPSQQWSLAAKVLPFGKGGFPSLLLHNILAEGCCFTCRITVTGFWE